MKKGFTILEMLVAVGLITFVFVVFANLQDIFTKGNLSTWKNYADVNAASSSIRFLVKEVRNAQYSQSGSYPFVTLSDNELIFFSDYDFDGVVEKIRYTLLGNTLTKGTTEPSGFPAVYNSLDEKTSVITEDIDNAGKPMFTYYDETYPQIISALEPQDRLARTKIVKFFVAIRADEEKNDYTLESSANIRILKTNI